MKKALAVLNSELENNIPLEKCQRYLLNRPECETDIRYRQIIPYVVINNEKGETFTYKRGTSGNEDRLHDLYSIGVGGHIEEDNGKSLRSILYHTAVREIEEEIGYVLDNEESISFIDYLDNLDINGNIIKMDDTDVNRVHLGVILFVTVNSEKVKDLKLEENVITDHKWMGIKDICDAVYNLDIILEPWSKYVIETFLRNLAINTRKTLNVINNMTAKLNGKLIDIDLESPLFNNVNRTLENIEMLVENVPKGQKIPEDSIIMDMIKKVDIFINDLTLRQLAVQELCRLLNL